MLLALTQRVVVDPVHGERRDALDQRWPRFLATAAMAAVALPNDPAIAVDLVVRLRASGIVLTGGDDLVEYGGSAPERDETERALLALAQSRGTPLLGVCRGMQAIQHMFGVRLQRCSGHTATMHEVIANGAPRIVNSFHELVATASVPELTIWATGPGNAVEAIRHRDQPITGIMWHPERNTPGDLRDIEFFQTFFGGRS